MILKTHLMPVFLSLGAIYMFMTIIVKQVYRYISQISGERLQNHWSSGFKLEVSSILLAFIVEIVLCLTPNMTMYM